MGAASTINNTFISISGELVSDYSLNQVVPVNRLQTAAIQDETLPPSLIQFILDLDLGELRLGFSEAVSLDTFNPLGITLQSKGVRDTDTDVRVLTGGTSNLIGTSQITLQLNNEDLNDIKLLSDLAASQSQTYIVVTANVLSDEQNSSLIEIPEDDAQMAAGLILDTTPPTLESFDLDMDGTGMLVLHFTEFVRTSSFSPRHVEFRETDSSPSYNVSLSSSTFTGDITDEVYIQFSTSDLEKLKLQPICTATTDCYLTILADVVTDLFGRLNTARQTSNPAPVANLTSDTTAPQLVSNEGVEEININTGEIVLLFDEPVNISSLDVTALMLHSSFRNDSNLITVSLSDNSTSSSLNGKMAHLNLSIEDIDDIKLELGLCDSASNCWVRLSPEFIMDMSGNPVAEVTFGELNAPQLFQEDDVRPILIAFDLDINNRLLVLLFNEPVNYRSLTIREVTLQASPNSTSSSIELTTSSPVSTENGREVEVELAVVDIEQIQDSDLGKTTNDTWITYTNLFIEDTGGNEITPRIADYNALQVRILFSDMIPPTLEAFLSIISTMTHCINFF